MKKRGVGVLGAILLMAAAIQLSSCAPRTVEAVRANYAAKYEYDVAENYQYVYKRVLEKAKKCHERGRIGAQTFVEGNLYSEMKSGDITVSVRGGFGVDIYLSINVRGLDDHNSRVQVYSGLAAANKGARAVRGWVFDNSDECFGSKE